MVEEVAITREGFLSVRCRSGYELLAVFLADTHCGTAARCQILLSVIRALEARTLPHWDSGYGNASAAEFDPPTDVVIESEFAAPRRKLRVPVVQFIEALETMLRFRLEQERT